MRQLVLTYFARLMSGFTDKEYTDYFEITKIFGLYMKIFGNQQFNQDVEKLSMKYVNKLLHLLRTNGRRITKT